MRGVAPIWWRSKASFIACYSIGQNPTAEVKDQSTSLSAIFAKDAIMSVMITQTHNHTDYQNVKANTVNSKSEIYDFSMGLVDWIRDIKVHGSMAIQWECFPNHKHALY